jgi:carbonic anhydrase/acetyltransferase-like protein (isoleucine patch superfamily)
VLGPGAQVGEGARLQGVALGDEADVAAGAVLEPGARVGCGARA